MLKFKVVKEHVECSVCCEIKSFEGRNQKCFVLRAGNNFPFDNLLPVPVILLKSVPLIH